MEKTVGWCCLMCNINFYLPEKAVDINEFFVYCPLCGDYEETVMNTIPSSPNLSEQLDTGLEVINYIETFSEPPLHTMVREETFIAKSISEAEAIQQGRLPKKSGRDFLQESRDMKEGY